MVQINFASQEIIHKLVYYGPSKAGKTSILALLDETLPSSSKGRLVSITNEAGRTLFFDHLPIDLGEVSGMRLKYLLYGVPGRKEFLVHRKNTLSGADGIIFLVDSQRDRLEENVEMLQELRGLIAQLNLGSIPLIFQYHKQDLPQALSAEELNRHLNGEGLPYFLSSMERPEEVFLPLKELASRTLERLQLSEIFSQASSRGRKKLLPRLDKKIFYKSLENLVLRRGSFRVSDIRDLIAKRGQKISRRAITRQLNALIREGKLQKSGYGKGTIYFIPEELLGEWMEEFSREET